MSPILSKISHGPMYLGVSFHFFPNWITPYVGEIRRKILSLTLNSNFFFVYRHNSFDEFSPYEVNHVSIGSSLLLVLRVQVLVLSFPLLPSSISVTDTSFHIELYMGPFIYLIDSCCTRTLPMINVHHNSFRGPRHRLLTCLLGIESFLSDYQLVWEWNVVPNLRDVSIACCKPL